MVKASEPQVRSEILDLVEQLTDQLQAGNRSAIEEILRQHPEEASQLREILPSLEILAELQQTACEEMSSGAGYRAGHHAAEPAQGMLGDFRIIRQIGQGGMGVVYEAQQISIQRTVALKVLPLAPLVDSKALQRFKNEVTAIATLEHPHIVSVYAVGEERGIHYYAMRLIRGQSLAAVIRELRMRAENQGSVTGESLNHVVSDMEDQSNEKTGSGLFGAQHPQGRSGQRDLTPFSKERVGDLDKIAVETQARGRSTTGAEKITDQSYFRNVVRLILQAAHALQHAHDHGIVHRDVKPANLLLDSGNCLFVTDFGLARIETGAGVTMTGDMMGTLRYMSPEQTLANRVVIDHRTDIYSLGATLYELLTLQPIWPSHDKAELIRQISFDEPVEPRKLNPSIPADLNTIVLKAISKNPEDRYQDAQSFADDLNRFLDHKPIVARRPAVSERFTKWCARHRVVVAATMVALVLVTITTAVAAVMIWNQSQLRQQALLEKQKALHLATKATKQKAATHDFILRNIVEAASPSQNGSRDITVQQALLAANEQLDGEFRDDPLMRAFVQSNFGHYLTELGEYELARKTLESAVATFTDSYDQHHADTNFARRQLIRVYSELDQHELAISTARRVFQISKLQFDPLDRRTVGAMWQLGVALEKKKRFSEAIEILQQVAQLAHEQEFSKLEALAAMELGNCCFYQQEYSAAESHWETALQQFRQLGKNQTNILMTEFNLANAYWETGRAEKSLLMGKQVVEKLTKLQGPDHPQTLMTMRTLAGRQFYHGDLPTALSTYQQLLDRTVERYGHQHEQSAGVMTALGTTLGSVGRLEEALQHQRHALEIEKAKFGNHHHQVLITLGQLGETYLGLKDLDEAEACYRQVINSRLEILESDPENLDNAVSLGGVYCNLGNFLVDEKKEPKEALDSFAKAISTLERITNSSPTVKGHRFLVNSYVSRSSAFETLGDLNQARRDAERAVALATSPGRKDSMRLYLARIKALEGDVGQAQQVVDDVLARNADGDMFYLAARVVALCASKENVSNDESGERYSNRVVELLEQAARHDFFEDSHQIDTLKSETDFDYLREFESLRDFSLRLREANEFAGQKTQQ